MSTPQSPAKTPSRRVLGDLTPKALNTPSKQTNILDPSDAMRARSPLKQVTTFSPRLLLGKENITGGPTMSRGRKRSIYEVESAEDVGTGKSIFKGRASGGRDTGARLTASAVQSFMDSDVNDVGQPGSPTEANTPSPEPEDPNSQNSFSMFVNYSACDSHNNTQEATAAPTSTPAPAPLLLPIAERSPPPKFQPNKKSRAELLRLRLGFGLYKVKTNQVSKRGSDIISTWETASSAENLNTSSATATRSSADLNTTDSVPNVKGSPTRKDRQPVFVKAKLDPFRPIGKLTPAPVLLPTAVSSRTIHDYHMPSSPPQDVPVEKLASPTQLQENTRTPTAKRMRDVQEGQDEVDKQEDDEEQEETPVQGRIQSLQRRPQDEVTSSTVKGNAAKGLLELSAQRR